MMLREPRLVSGIPTKYRFPEKAYRGGVVPGRQIMRTVIRPLIMASPKHLSSVTSTGVASVSRETVMRV